MATQHGPWMNHLDGLVQHFDTMVDIDGFGERDGGDKKFTKILHDACLVVWDAEKKSSPDLPVIVEKAHVLIDKAFKYGFAHLAMEHPRCYAHSKDAPAIQDSLQMTGRTNYSFHITLFGLLMFESCSLRLRHYRGSHGLLH